MKFWPLTASTISEVKKDHAHVITQNICNTFIELKFSVGKYGLSVIASVPPSTTSKTIDKIPMQVEVFLSIEYRLH